jgi:hypothetical protein
MSGYAVMIDMINSVRNVARSAGLVAAGAVATVALAGPASAAPAIYFPFNSCYEQNYWNIPQDNMEAVFNHYDNNANLNFYLVYVNGELPNPHNINDSANWASCTPD